MPASKRVIDFRKWYTWPCKDDMISNGPHARLEWIRQHGPIPRGMFVCHHCDNPPCREIEHLFLGTHADNMADMKAKGRQRGGVASRPLRPNRIGPRVRRLSIIQGGVVWSYSRRDKRWRPET